MFTNQQEIASLTWQAFEREISRLLVYEGFIGVRTVGQTGDRGADIIGSLNGTRWVFQAKHWKKPVGITVIDEVLTAAKEYKAKIPVIVSLNGFESTVKQQQQILHLNGIPLQLWDSNTLVSRAKRLSGRSVDAHKIPRQYQETAITEILQCYFHPNTNKALVVMATGLGKTFVAAEALRRIRKNQRAKTLVVAHTNDLIYQLQRSFWGFMSPEHSSVIWNGYEHPTMEQIDNADIVFACVDSLASFIAGGNELPKFDMLVVDECHHVGTTMYQTLFDELRAGELGGAFALGLTATPWRPDEANISQYFGEPRVSIDMLMGLRNGFLTNVDYRMYTDNIDWQSLRNLKGRTFTPKQINRTFFINQWDDAVVYELRAAWNEQSHPRAIVFCGTIDHAKTMRDKINSLGFCKASAIYSQSKSKADETLTQFERNRMMSDFADGQIDVICAVDVFNEGIDVPDVNILVFQRVTHSRRIFIQQLGRGLRISEGKEKVIVLDFVSDIRRFAAGINLKDSLNEEYPETGTRINLPNKVVFRKTTGEDTQAESFLREWLNDVVAIENAGEDASVLHFPPLLAGGKQ